MILKFDHMAFACRYDEIELVKQSCEGYAEIFYERNIVNLPVKRKLMDSDQDDHDIVLMEREGFLPVEITAYKNVRNVRSRYSISKRLVTVKTFSKKKSDIFYRSVGFQEINDGMLELKPVLDAETVKIIFEEAEKKEYLKYGRYLDDTGFCGMALITDNVDKERARLAGKNVAATDIMSLELHGKKMKIFFAYNDIGDICEFIGFR